MDTRVRPHIGEESGPLVRHSGTERKKSLLALRTAIAAAAVAVQLLSASPALAQFDMGLLGHGSFVGASADAPARPAPSARVLDPVSLGAPPLVQPATHASRLRYDVAVVLLQPGGTAGAPVLAETEAFWARRGMRVAPREVVAGQLAALGVLTPAALAGPDYARLGTMIGARYLILLSAARDGARRQVLGSGPASTAVRVAGAGALVGLRPDLQAGHGAGMNLAAVALIGGALLVAGVTTVATCELSAQIVDCPAGRTIWLHSTAATARKVLFGLFAGRRPLASRARKVAVARLFGDVAPRLRRPAASRPQSASTRSGLPDRGGPGESGDRQRRQESGQARPQPGAQRAG